MSHLIVKAKSVVVGLQVAYHSSNPFLTKIKNMRANIRFY